MMKRLLLMTVIVIIAGCNNLNPPLTVIEGTSGSPPVILDFYTYSVIRAGRILPVFVEVKDPDGDMAGFRVEVSQVGGNMYDRFFVPLRDQYKSYAKGYLAMQIPNMNEPERLKIYLYAVDITGRRSQLVSYDVSIGLGRLPEEQLPDKWVDARKTRLGNIFFEFQLEREGRSNILIKK